MSQNKKTHSSDAPDEIDKTLSFFDDIEQEPQKDAPAGKAADNTALPDFREEDDRTAILPEKDDITPPQKKDADKKTSAKKTARPKKAEKKDEDGPSDKADGHKKEKKSGAGKKSAVKKNTEAEDEVGQIGVVGAVKPKGTKLSKFIFILSMCLITPFAVLLVLTAVILFALIISAALLIAGALTLALVALVVAGVILALTGIIYGVFQMITKEGFSFYTGVYELGLGLAITGITIVISSLLYSGASTLVPFVSKQIARLFKFIARKIKALIVRIYKYSTSL